MKVKRKQWSGTSTVRTQSPVLEIEMGNNNISI